MFLASFGYGNQQNNRRSQYALRTLLGVRRGPTACAPATELLGLKVVRTDADRAEFEATFEARPEFVNPTGKVQGGFLAAMLDETLGPALASTLTPDEFAPTLELKVNFLRPAAPGTLTGKGRVVHCGGHIAFLAGELLAADGTAVATATATARVLKHDWKTTQST